ncbi:nucleotidyltransferase family protein [Cognatishimia sp. SS12]|uniref:nucleotidyltransferase family protein n=1 Tax=Cognatishimia sp. SS12 TaxID=2979465 RepID=UPI00232D8BB9|nr:nucleotidyltransferase family protein [Cognatishimia sp. SS12]MDC0739620.1 nucleotidyltransferase family protein [Cognatishimia sp. SS12]
MKTIGILLAAGRSSRFGGQDKLLADLNGRPLVQYAAAALLGAECDHAVAVVRPGGVPPALLGMAHLTLPGHDAPQSASVKLGLAYAQEHQFDCAVIVLGDMPFITPEIIRSVADLSTLSRCAAAQNRNRTLPPVAIPASQFEAALKISGDQGARALTRDLPPNALLEISDKESCDIDTLADLRAATS